MTKKKKTKEYDYKWSNEKNQFSCRHIRKRFYIAGGDEVIYGIFHNILRTQIYS